MWIDIFSSYSVNIFADIRKQLYKKGLLQGGKPKNLGVGEKLENSSSWRMCGVTEICSNKVKNTHDWNNDKPYECGLETLEG